MAKGKSSSTRKANKSPISKEPKSDKPAPTTVTELLKKPAQQKSPAAFFSGNGASVSVTVKPKNLNTESPKDTLLSSTSAPADKEKPQTSETINLDETVETPNTPPKDDPSKQTGEELPDSEINSLVETELKPPITLNEETVSEQLEEPRSNIFQTSDEDSLSDPGTQDQDRETLTKQLESSNLRSRKTLNPPFPTPSSPPGQVLSPNPSKTHFEKPRRPTRTEDLYLPLLSPNLFPDSTKPQHPVT